MKRTIAVAAVLIAACSPPSAPDPDSRAAARRARAPLTVERSDAGGFVVRFRPDVEERTVTLAGGVYDSLSLAGSTLPTLPGTPAIPLISRPFTLPEGATATARVVSLRTRARTDAWLRPTPPRWEDNLDAPNPPVTERPEDYGSSRTFPDELVAIRSRADKLAGVPSGVLTLAAARFRPAERRLELVEDLVVEVRFDRPFDGRPAPRRAADRRFGGEFINADLIGAPTPGLLGPEYLIVTDDLFRPAADRLAVWKRQKGISTLVVSTSVIGSTRAAISGYIQNLYDAPGSRLAYLLLLGDVDKIPTYYRDNFGNSDDTLATDLPYAKLDGPDAHADIAYGRISVDELWEADRAVDRTLDYEQTPADDPAYYDAMAFSGYFQDDARPSTLNVHGVLVTSNEDGGHDLYLEIVDPVIGPVPETVTVVDGDITVILGTDGNGAITTTWRDVVAAINADPSASALVTASEQPDEDEDGVPEHDLTDTAFTVAQQLLEDGQVQDGEADKPYIDVLEEIRDVMLGHGKTVDRLYSTNTIAPVVPLDDYDGMSLPPELLVSNGFLWDADHVAIDAAIDAGRALVFHRDHGSQNGWAHPRYDIGNHFDLSNGDVDPADAHEDRYPVMFNVSCSTGRFDQETDSAVAAADVQEAYAEWMIRAAVERGAVALIAASRASNTDKNQLLARGLFDAYWPNVIIGFNRTTAGAPTTFRLGDALIYAKDWQLTNIEIIAIAGIANPDDEAYMIDQVEMYHLHGDPTLEMWTEAPLGFGVIAMGWRELVPGQRVLRVQVESAVGTPHVALWQGDVEASAARLVSEARHGGKVRRVYELDEPPGVATTTTSLYVTQAGHRPSITTIAPP